MEPSWSTFLFQVSSSPRKKTGVFRGATTLENARAGYFGGKFRFRASNTKLKCPSKTMVYGSRLPAVRLGNDARTKKKKSLLSLECSEKKCAPSRLCARASVHPLDTIRDSFKVCRSQPNMWDHSQCRLETPLHRYTRGRAAVFLLTVTGQRVLTRLRTMRVLFF